MCRAAWAALWLALLAGASSAQDYVTTDGPLSDIDFYRLVSCGAAPGAACSKPVLRWPDTAPVSVGITHIDRAFLGGKQARARAAVARAVQYLNGAGMGLQLVEAQDPMIRVHLIDTDGDGPIVDRGIDAIEGATVRGARVIVRAKGGTITEADIVFGTRLHIRHYESAMIEEITQALGLLTDIRNPAYEGLSVFSEDSNDAKTLGPQDIDALRRHYPVTRP